MTAPVVKCRGKGITKVLATANASGKNTSGIVVVLATSDPCPVCGTKGHLISDHSEEKARQCNLCSCVAQDTDVG